MTLDEYIENCWLDFPVNKIDIECGQLFAQWMSKNEGDAYILAMSSLSIISCQMDLSSALINEHEIEIKMATKDLKVAICVEFRDILLDAIGNFHNSFDSVEEEKFESISFDSERIL